MAEALTTNPADPHHKVSDNFVVSIRTGNEIAKESERLRLKRPVLNAQVKELVKSTHAILTEQMPEFTSFNYMALEIENDLLLAITKYKGLGLAAPQIGLRVNACVVGQDNAYEVMFNPKILEASLAKSKAEEGCLSFPNLFLNVERSDAVRVEWQNAKGERIEHSFNGLSARIIQHEIDHLNGILITSKVSAFELRRAKERQSKKNKTRFL